MTTGYTILLSRILASALPELYPGQNAELASMANAVGCDINEHVPTLVGLGREVRTITEMGVRFGWSTRSFLFARPASLLSIDKFNWGSTHQSGAIVEQGLPEKYQGLYRGITDFRFVIGDTTKIDPIPETDLLFIDTFHHRDCLAIELERHGNRAKKLIVLHDTETFGECGQADTSGLFFDRPTTSEVGTGLWYAIRPFLARNPHWKVRTVYHNNNGLAVLERTR